jgi:sulfoxide reductase heme-binding subunit YedZ
VDSHFAWYLVRASGVVTFGLLTFATALGLSISSRLGGRPLVERPWIFELHKFASLLALAFLGVHMGALLLDSWVTFTLSDLLMPGVSSYRPVAVAAGVLAMYGSLVGIGTFYVKKWIGYRAWRVLHHTTFLTFTLALLHGTLSGADSHEPWMRLLYIGAGLLVFLLVLYRITVTPGSIGGKRKRPNTAHRPAPAPADSSAAPFEPRMNAAV